MIRTNMPSDQEIYNTINKITNTASLFSMTGYSPKQSSYKDNRAELFYKLLEGLNRDRKRAGFKLITKARLGVVLNTNVLLKVNEADNNEELHALVEKCEKAGNWKLASWILFPKKK